MIDFTVETLTDTIVQAGGSDGIAKLIGVPGSRWAHDCHHISIAIVKTGLFGPAARVARGTCSGVIGQHSWIAPSGDCYDDEPIVDPTLWSYLPGVPVPFVGPRTTYRHEAHGTGNIWTWGRPPAATGNPIELTPARPLSPEAKRFLLALGPLDLRGWVILASQAPVDGWPAGEILAAMDDTEALGNYVPIDRLGMLTDRNPAGLYLARRKAS